MRSPVIFGLLMALASSTVAVAFPAKVVLKVGAAQTQTYQARLADLLATRLADLLPGHPQISIEYVDGASGVQLSRQMVETEPRDGSMVGAVSLVASRSHVIDPEGLGFDPSGLRWVAALTRPVWVCEGPKSLNIKPGETDLIFGAATKRDATYVMPSLLRDKIMPGKVNIVVGFKSAMENYAALDRGETTAVCSSYAGFFRDKRDETDAIFLSFGKISGSAGEGIPDVLDQLDDLDRQAISIASAVNQPFNTFALPTGTPDDVVELYRTAFATLDQDADFRAKTLEILKDYTFTSGADLQAFVDSIAGAGEEVIARAKALQK